MKKIIKIICSFTILLSIMSINISSVYAHDPARWAEYYPASSADSTNSFGIGDCYHIST